MGTITKVTSNRKTYRRSKAKLPKVSKATKTYVQRAIKAQGDKRFTYTTIGTTGIDHFGQYVTGASLLQTNTGDNDFAERQGDVITPTRIIMRYAWTASDTYNTCRLILFQWHPDSNSFPPTAILNNVVDISTLGTSNAPLSRYIFDQKNFTVLYDSTHTVCDLLSNQHVARTVNIYGKKLKKIRYTNGVIEGHNNLYLIAISDSGAGGNPLFQATMEMHYLA